MRIPGGETRALYVRRDATPPSITCPTNVVVQCDSNVPPANFSGGIVTDAADPSPVVSHVSDVASGSCPITITRTYRATDASGNTNDCAQTITVHDTTPPIIVCPTNMIVLCAGTNGAVVVFSASATDNCDPSVVAICTPPSGSVFHEGTNIVTCVAVDDCGNTNTCAFIIRVDDPAGPPTISIARQGADVVICWPESCTSYELEQSSVLPAVMWTPAGGTLTISGGQYCVTLPIGSSNQFVRLKKL